MNDKCRIFTFKKNFLIVHSINNPLIEKSKIEEAGVFSFVCRSKKPKFSKNLSEDVNFSLNFDINTSLPALTYPVFNPLTQEIISVFQIIIWQETFDILNSNNLNRSNSMLYSFASLFSKFFGFMKTWFDYREEKEKI